MIDFKRTQKEGYDLNKLTINLSPGPRTALPSYSGAKGSHSNNYDENKFYSYAISLCFLHDNNLYNLQRLFFFLSFPSNFLLPLSTDSLSELKIKPFI